MSTRRINRYRGHELGTEAMKHVSYSLGGPGTRFPITWYTRHTSAARVQNANADLRRLMLPLVNYLVAQQDAA